VRDLPYDRALIQQAIFDALQANPDPVFHEQLKVALISLDLFVSEAEFEAVANYEGIVEKIGDHPNEAETPATRQFVDEIAILDDCYRTIQRRVREKQEKTMECLHEFLGTLSRD